MFPPFDEEEAFEICTKIIHGLESGVIKMVQVSPQSIERGGHGIMLGAAVCLDQNGNKIMIATLSGISRRLEHAAEKHSDKRNGFLLSEGGADAQAMDFPHKIEENHTTKNEVEDFLKKLIFVGPIAPQEKINSALQKNDGKIHDLTDRIKNLKEKRKISENKFKSMSEEEKKLRAERKTLCDESLEKVFALYSFHCFDGKKRTLTEISSRKLPPTGTGDCSAPKLIDYAFSRKYKIQSLCEVYYGKENSTKKSGKKYAPCDERCSIILPEMLGLKIIYRDKDIVVLEKQSGLLSVPGRGPEKADCVVSRFKNLFPDAIEQPSIHRLDMETSGLLVIARTADAHRNLSRQFEEKEVYKEYEAVLDGVVESKGGILELYFRLDVENRPHQIWDAVHGKKAVTEYENLGTEKYKDPAGHERKVTRMRFIPRTGRTHQLRLASADSHGLNVPIVGDTLYGKALEGERLLLHATVLEFLHPATKNRMRFESKSEFSGYFACAQHDDPTRKS